MTVIISLVCLLYAVILHEIAHGLVADRLGDPTARLSKRLTLNPIPHIDPFMSILLPFTLILSGSPLVFGASKPVPVDPYNLRNPRRDMGLISLAGPVSNLLIAIVLSLLFRLIPVGSNNYIFLIFYFAIRINVVLAIFNLIPIPPLDGGHVLTAILPKQYGDALASIERYGFLILLILLLFPSPFFSIQGVISKIAASILNILLPVPMMV